MGIAFDHVDAWTKLEEGVPREVAAAAVAAAVSHAPKRPSKRDERVLADEVQRVAITRDELEAHDCFVLTSDAPVVQLLAYSFIMYDVAPDAADRTLEAALAAHPDMAGEHEVTSPRTDSGKAHRIVTRFRGAKRGLRRTTGATQVQWIRCVDDGTSDITATIATIVPRTSDEPLVLPLVDAFALGVTTTSEDDG